MGSVPVFQNPYGRNASSPSQIDTVIGTAYEVVREVAENLEYVKHVSAHMEQVFKLAGSTQAIDLLAYYLEEIAVLLEHIEEVLLVAASLDELMEIHADLAKLQTLYNNLGQLSDIYDNLDEILAKGGTVIVSETPPVTDVSGKLWWETDSGNLYAWYDDGTSGQWVQINIASTSYSWTDILDKPSTFPPTNHVHAEDVKKIGDKMTGNLVISPPVGISALWLESTVGNANQISGRRVGADGIPSNRWQLILGNTLAESGGVKGSTGSDFEIKRNTNDGGLIDTPILIPRSTGVPFFANGLTSKVPVSTSNDGTVATTSYVKNQINSFNDIVGNTLTVAGQTVIHVVNDPEVLGYSVAWGDGLLKTTHKLGSTEGLYNTAVGLQSLFALTTGNYNTSLGFRAALKLTTGYQNTALGEAALQNLTIGYYNTAIGRGAMYGDTTQIGKWHNNTAVGLNAMYDIKDTAVNNTGVGWGVMSDTGVTDGLSGQNNTAMGVNSLHSITSGNNNESFGYLALGTVTTGNNNIGVGYNAGGGIISGSGNVIIGHNMGALAPTLSNSLIISVENGTQVVTGGKTGVFMRGTSGNTVPLAGFVGEYKEINLPITSDKTMVNKVAINVCSLALTPGDWDVYGWVGYTGGASTSITRLIGCLSLVSATLDYTTPGAATCHTQIATIIGAASSYFQGVVGYRRMSISVSDTVYLVSYANFTGNAPSVYGKIWARRMR